MSNKKIKTIFLSQKAIRIIRSLQNHYIIVSENWIMSNDYKIKTPPHNEVGVHW